MTLERRRCSVLFSNPQKSSYRLQIENALTPHKVKLHINNRSISTPKKRVTEKLTLEGATKIQKLYQTISFKSTSTTNKNKNKKRNPSLNEILKNFERNCCENIEELKPGLIDEERMKLFRKGQYYWNKYYSKSTANTLDHETISQYFKFDDELEEEKKKKKNNDHFRTISACSNRKNSSLMRKRQNNNSNQINFSSNILPTQSINLKQNKSKLIE